MYPITNMLAVYEPALKVYLTRRGRSVVVIADYYFYMGEDTYPYIIAPRRSSLKYII